jgi:hypothetical protein
MKMKKYLLMITMIALITACSNPAEKSTPAPDIPVIHEVVVEEVQQAREYTYLYVREGKGKYWMAVTRIDAAPGESYIYTDGMEMKNFESKDLNRVFESVWFVSDLRPGSKDSKTGGEMPTSQMSKVRPEQKEVNVTPVQGGVTIAELYASPEKYEGKEVLVKGEVVKVNPNIMNRNWVHIQDGTQHEGRYNLTLTTTEMVNEEEIVIFKGTIALNRDFGAGYTYDLIMEETFQASLR